MNGNKNECAFPVPDDHPWSFGMTLRDYFAAKAMQAFLHADMRKRSLDDIAWDAYLMSDSMLKEREVEEE